MKYKDDLTIFKNTFDVTKILLTINELRKDVNKIKDTFEDDHKKNNEQDENLHDDNEEENKEEQKSISSIREHFEDVEKNPSKNNKLESKAYSIDKFVKSIEMSDNAWIDKESKKLIKVKTQNINKIISREMHKMREEKKDYEKSDSSIDFKLSREHDHIKFNS